MIWAMFAGSMNGPIHIVEGTINAEYYVYEMLAEHLPFFRTEVLDAIGEEPMFMQDNARVHTARHVCWWFDETVFLVLKWSSYSPDLDPIDHAWKHLKVQLHKLHPDVLSIKSNTEACRRIKEVIAEV